MKTFKVGVFLRVGIRKDSFTAYTTWYNPQWSGCCEHTVDAVNGTEAKRLAISQHKEHCLEKQND